MDPLPTLDGPRLAPASGGPARALIMLLHGLGADGHDLIGLAPVLARHFPHAAFVSPHGPEPCDMAPMGYQWFSLQDRRLIAMRAGADAAAPVLDAFIDAELARHNVTPDRLALVGFSQGTMMALHVGLRRPSPCAAIVGFSGSLTVADDLAREVRARPPVLLVHGTDDPIVPIMALHDAVRRLKEAAVPVEWEVRPGLPHAIDEPGLARAVAFLGRHLPA